VTYRLQFFDIAEGAVADMRGSVVMTGVAPEFLVGGIPFVASPTFVLLAAEEEPYTDWSGRQATATLAISDPEGVELTRMPFPINMSGKRWADLPGRMAVMIQYPITIEKRGRYTATMRVASADEVLADATMSFLAVDQSEAS